MPKPIPTDPDDEKNAQSVEAQPDVDGGKDPKLGAEAETPPPAVEEVISETTPEVEAPAPAPEKTEVVPEVTPEVVPTVAPEAVAPASPVNTSSEQLEAMKAELAALQQKVAEAEATRVKDLESHTIERAKLVDGGFTLAMTAARIQPAYQAQARTELGDIDPTTDAGKAAIDAWATAHPVMLQGFVARPATEPEKREPPAKNSSRSWVTQSLLDEMEA